jgi:diguanylate cyclase (GGDEF)-like protein/PAS domain S-box-containing protein
MAIPSRGSADQRPAPSEAALRELPEALILVFDDELRFVLSAGQALARSAHASATFSAGMPIAAAFPADLWRLLEPLCRSALQGETRSRELWSDDGRHGLMVDVGPLHTGRGIPDTASGPPPPAGGVAVVLDISARPLAARTRSDPREHLELIFDHAPIGMGLLDHDGRWVLVNHALCEITGYTAGELIGSRFHDIAHPDDAENDSTQRQQLLGGELAAYQTEKRYFNAAGESMSALLAISLVRDRDGAPLHFIVQLQDISERKRLEERLRHLADHDPLTGLRNRRLFEHDLKLQVARSERYGETAGLLVVALDSFRGLTDSHGQEVGEEALKALARALTRRLRQTDLVARLGAGEFAVLLPHIDAEGITVVAEGLARVIPAYTIDTGDAVLHLSASIGSAVIDRRTVSAEQALAEAVRAVQMAKYSTASPES